ncbi:alpha/beta fold hydrolase [Falsiroseomonas oryzae]|uniref:alpha/beta fold hydrolase n=1 Tax=Falsiroseomonas oryzae TaxID=2766473 RepID=UPI0022EB40BC|nr:alpha/beta hydrolase [Roseomonas sp. MO-31]
MSLAPPPGRVPPGTRRVVLSRGAVFVGSGVGVPILCIPGGYHGAWCFTPWLKLFAEAGIAAAALEPRGKGTLDAAADPATGVEDYAADAVEAAAALGGRVVLLGHSLGALVAMRAAARMEGVAGLLLAAPSPPGNLPEAAPVPTVPEGALLRPPVEKVVVARYLGGMRPEGLSAYRAALSPESPRALNDRYALRIPVEPARLAGVPVLVLEAGRDDPERHPAGQDEAIARFLDGAHQLLPEAPHCLMTGPWAVAGAAPLIAWHRTQLQR